MISGDLREWTAVIAECAPGASVRGVRRLGGGLSAETFSVDTTDGTVVVKRYPRRRTDTARFEWERLRFVQRVDAPVPRPLALDTEGRWFGIPALAMSHLAGRPNVRPGDVEKWLQQLAHALAAIHSTDTAGAAGPLLQPSAAETWKPPKLRRPSELTDRAVATIQRHLPRMSWQPVLLHGDFHPGNTLWNGDRLTGIADWNQARLGPAAYELAYCRADVALLVDRAAADRLTDHYAAITGAPPANLPVFDLICGLEALRSAARMRTAYRQQGRTDSPQQFTVRAASFLHDTLPEMGER